ncbi:uncharacterized protein LOC129718876 [Wyeomyia smithii]|uniref:uncharacterized protein LOC129718876 n=1 Tax=Wyeomyia smithii TaxID=174621 RepID=UPI002467D3D3|nr:uncharacterized protein LOC129718876 [Wyeomyia smithii]
MAARMAPSHILWLSGVLLLLNGLICVRSELKKSWKVKSDNENNAASLGPDLSILRSDKSARLEPEAPQQEQGHDDSQVQMTTEGVELKTLPTEAASSSTAASSQTTRSRLRSTYVANKTSSVYSSSVRESAKVAPFMEDLEPDIQIDDVSADETDEYDEDLRLLDNPAKKATKDNRAEMEGYAEGYEMIENILEEVHDMAEKEKPSQKPQQTDDQKEEETKKYNFPPVLNMTFDEPNNIVNVKLNGKVIKEIFTGRGSGFGGGAKKIWKYAAPLFVLPFLIQSAIIPFMLTTVKLFLVKSFLAGKLAIFLLLLGAFKNFTHKRKEEVYVKDLPERRYEPYNSEWPYPYHADSRDGGWS